MQLIIGNKKTVKTFFNPDQESNIEESEVIKGMGIKGHKIKILKDSQGIPLKIFLDNREVIGVDKIEIKYSYDCCNRKKVQKISLRLIDFESLEVTGQDV